MRRIGLGLAGFLVAGLMLWGLLSWRDRQMLKQLRAEMGIARRDSVITELGHEVLRTDTAHRERVREYPVYRDRLISQNPGNKPLADLAGKCDQLILTCDARIKASDVLADSLRAQVEAIRKLKAKSPPRFLSFAFAGMNVLTERPLAQVGGDARLFGPVNLSAYIEVSSDTNERAQVGGVVGVRFVFR